MKKNFITKVLLFLAFSLTGANCTLVRAQSKVTVANQKHVTLNLTHASVKEVLNEIKKQTGINFFYSTDLAKTWSAVNVNVRSVPVSQVLNSIMPAIKCQYRIEGDIVIITRHLDENTTRSVVGHVFDESGEPLPGVSICIGDSKVCTITDSEGYYSIKVPSTACTLSYSYIGMNNETVSLKAGSQGVIRNVKMDSNNALNEVVVTGYQTMKKYNMTGAVNVVSNKEISLRSSNDLQSLLEGEVPGLTVYDGTYRIRGGASLNSGTSPLIIVDNFEVEQLPENMDQVETITVLKDAAATAIWGSRAANGVIVITTKKGSTEKPTVSYSGNIRISAKPDYSDLHRASSSDIVNYDKDAFLKGYYFPGYFDYSTNGYSLSQEILKDYLVDDPSTLSADKLSEMNNRLDALAKQSNRDQINRLLLRQALRQNHMISVSGNNGNINYFVSGSYTGSHSDYKQGDSQSLFEVNSKVSVHLLENLKLRTAMYAAFERNNNGYTSLASDIYNLYPYQMLLDGNGSRVYDYSAFNHAQASSMVSDYGYADEGKNLLEEIQLADNKRRDTDYKVSVGLDYMLIKGLSLNADYQYEKLSSNTNNILSADSYYTRDLINSMAAPSEDGSLTYHLPKGNILDHSQYDTNSWVLKLGSTLNRSFGSSAQHYVNMVAGFEMRGHHQRYSSYRKLGYDTQTLSWQPIDEVQLKNGYTWWDGETRSYDATYYDTFRDVENRELSYFVSGTYTYDNRYTGSASLRFDETNLFGASYKFRRNPIYAFGASWNIKNEKFFHFKPITSLMLRTSFGVTGNFDRSGATTPVMVGSRRYYASIDDYIIRLTTPPNAKLRWERNRSINTSLDFGLYNRINGSLTYYNNFCYDLLGKTLIDPTNGYSTATINAANMRNHGWELELAADVVRTKDWNWNLRWVFSYNKNKITKNSTNDSEAILTRVTGTTRFVEGYPREAIWSYRWAGLDDKGEPQVYNSKGEKTYDIATLSTEDLEYSGTYQPKYNGSLTSSIRFRQLTLNMMFVYNFGHVFRAEYPGMSPYDASPSMSDKVAQRWQNPGDENVTDIACLPAMEDLWAHTNYRNYACMYSSNSIRKGDMIRLREILLNYELPKSLIGKTFMKSLSLTLQLNNVWLWTANREGYDPEAVDPLTGKLSLPQPFSWTAGVKIDF